MYRPEADKLCAQQGSAFLVAFLHVQVAVPLAYQRNPLLPLLICHMPRNLPPTRHCKWAQPVTHDTATLHIDDGSVSLNFAWEVYKYEPKLVHNKVLHQKYHAYMAVGRCHGDLTMTVPPKIRQQYTLRNALVAQHRDDHLHRTAATLGTLSLCQRCPPALCLGPAVSN